MLGLVQIEDFAKGDRAVVDGVPTIALTSAELGDTLYVATVGEPNPVRLELPGGIVVSYSEHGQPVVIEEPPADEVVDLVTVIGGRP